MIVRQFLFTPKNPDIIDKDFYSDVATANGITVLSLKDNMRIGYAPSFYDGMDYISEMVQHFVVDSVTEINMRNEIAILSAKGINTNETFANLMVEHFNYCLPDIQAVTIEVKGILRPKTSLKGSYRGFYRETFNEISNEVTLFSPLKGGLPLSNQLLEYEDNLLTQIKMKIVDSEPYVEIGYLGVNVETGQLYRSTICPFTALRSLKLDYYLPYQNIFKKGLVFIRKNKKNLA